MINAVNFFEIGSVDPATSRRFYGSLFGWQIGPPSDPAQYSMVEVDRGGLWDTSAMEENWAIFYVQVDNVEEAVDRAQSLGASVALPLIENGAIEFAHLMDPLGNRFGVWRPTH